MDCNDQTLHGAFPALVTPFNKDSSIDFDSLATLIDYQLQAGVAGVVACGSSGEGQTLTDDEYGRVVSFCRDRTAKKVICIAGIGTNSTVKAVEMAQFVTEAKVDGILLVAPPYNKPSQDGIVAHFSQVSKHTKLPLIAYNVPGRTAVNILPATINLLAEKNIIVGVKEASGSIDQVMDIAAKSKNLISILSGEDSLVHAVLACGGRGVISASANIIPELFVKMIAAFEKGDISGSLRYQIEALPIVRLMFKETNPVPVKAALALKGIIKHGGVRLPLLAATEDTIEMIQAIIQK